MTTFYKLNNITNYSLKKIKGRITRIFTLEKNKRIRKERRLGMLNELNSKIKDEYLDYVVKSTIDCHSSTIQDTKVSDNVINNRNAFRLLLEDKDCFLTQEKIIQVGDLVNETSPYIPRGYRKIGKYLADTQIPIPEATQIPTEINNLLKEYQNQDTLGINIFEQEARFHIAFIRIQPFADGNKRTARLILNANLLHKNIAPVIITEDLLEYYYSYIENYDVEGMENLFRIQSKKQESIIQEFQRNNGMDIKSNKTKRR